MSEMIIKNVSDGAEISSVVVGAYLNSFSCTHPIFMNLMLGEKDNIKQNLTILCLEWFRALAKVDYYDDRNEDSVVLARAISRTVMNDTLTNRKLAKRGIRTTRTVNYRSCESMQDLISDYLKLADDNEAFIHKTLNVHKTLQQNFSRFCLEWFKRLVEEENSRKGYVKLAAKANKHYTTLRYI